MNDENVTLRVENVTKRFGDFTAVDGLSFEVRAGRVFGFLGPNGAGKTTTIRMIVGITAPDEGRIELFGNHVSSEMQNRIGYLPEERGLYKKMKVLDQLRYFAALKGVDEVLPFSYASLSSQGRTLTIAAADPGEFRRFTRIEVGQADEVWARARKDPSIRYSALVPNLKGLERAIVVGRAAHHEGPAGARERMQIEQHVVRGCRNSGYRRAGCA